MYFTYKSRRIVTQDYKNFKAFVSNYLKTERKDQLNEFAKKYDSGKHTITMRFIFYFPRARIFNKDGTIKARRFDCDNYFKPINDIIFEHMEGVDDAFIFNNMGIKAISPDDDFHIEVRMFRECIKKVLNYIP